MIWFRLLSLNDEGGVSTEIGEGIIFGVVFLWFYHLLSTEGTRCMFHRALAILIVLLCSPAIFADDPASHPAPPATTEPAFGDKLSVTEHEITVASQSLRYRVTAGTLAQKD